jgi:hypothetical protein
MKKNNMDEFSVPTDTKKIALINGSILGVINIVMLLFVFYVLPKLLESFIFSLVQLLTGIGLVVYFCLHIRRKIGGYWSFKEALSSSFILLFQSGLILFFFTLVFGRFIDPSYPVKMKAIAIAKYVEAEKKFEKKTNVSQIDISDRIERQLHPGPADLLKSVCTMAIIYFVGALLFAAIFKRERPSTFSIQDQTEV